MTVTPTKSTADPSTPTQTLTPIRFIDNSPRKSIAADANFATCKSRLDLIVGTLQSDYAKWQLAQKRGLSLCSSIEAIKTRILEAADKAPTAAASAELLYPQELKAYCDKLAIIGSIFVDITNNTREFQRQLQTLHKLINNAGGGDGSSSGIFYRTWQMSQFTTFIQELLERYNEETLIKQLVIQELAHCMTRADLIRYTSAWEYPAYVTEKVSLMFKFLAEETDVNKKR